jgi:hypothetical protein
MKRHHMKWNKQSKILLYSALTKKAEQLVATIPPGEERDGQWELFLKSHGIVRAERDDPDGYCRKPAWRSLEDNECLADRKRTLIEDPYNEDPYNESHYGLSIPKETAEKFLVLGIP